MLYKPDKNDFVFITFLYLEDFLMLNDDSHIASKLLQTNNYVYIYILFLIIK